jgi:translation initiation factor 2 alpha subunit (eIF-2alpha)
MGISLREAEITKAINNWKEQKNGEGYLSRLRELIGRDPSTYLDTAGKELEEKFRSGLEQAETRTKKQTKSAKKISGPISTEPRLVPVAHDPFEANEASNRAMRQ